MIMSNNNVFEHLNELKILNLLTKLRIGSFEMSRQQFRNALKRSIGAGKEYADGCWNHFRDAPMHYICSRQPENQGLELVRVCMKLATKLESRTR